MSEANIDRLAQAVERVGMVLAATYATHLGDMDQNLKVERLSRCGLANPEIAVLLGMTSNAVNVALHRARKVGKKSKTKGRRRK